MYMLTDWKKWNAVQCSFLNNMPACIPVIILLSILLRVINLFQHFWGMCCFQHCGNWILFTWKLKWLEGGNRSIVQEGCKDCDQSELWKGKSGLNLVGSWQKLRGWSEIANFSHPYNKVAHSSETSAQIIILQGVISQKEDCHFNSSWCKSLKLVHVCQYFNKTCKSSVQYTSRYSNFDKFTGICARLKSTELKYPPPFTSLQPSQTYLQKIAAYSLLS
jgi:hypothetical protein